MDKRAIAEEYLLRIVKPGMLHAQAVVESYVALARECTLTANALRSRFNIREVPNAEPYLAAIDMFTAIECNRFVVSNLYCEHPLWTPAENVNFRIVHDIFGHWGRGFGDTQAPFSWAGEQTAYYSQSRFHSALARKALFTEIIGQTACFSLTGEFPEQKAIILTET